MAVCSWKGNDKQAVITTPDAGRGLSMWQPKISVPLTLNTTTDAVNVGSKFFELANHLGNILATVSDRKIPHIDASGLIDYFMADVTSAQDYAPFGMSMVGRGFSAGSYRFGFNGKENDKETTTQDYGMRIYDPRLGRFLSVDPLTNSYPWYTPYQFSGNKPIWTIDLDGLEEAAPEEKARARKYLTQTISAYILKNDSYSRFKKMNSGCLVEELITMLSTPGEALKRQGSGVGNMCGIYAFSYLYALYKPTEFIKGVASLYVTGETEINNSITLKAIKGIENQKSDFSNQSLPVFILGGSIRDKSNLMVDYGGLAAKYWGSTNTSTMKNWISNFLGADASEVNSFTEKTLQSLTSHVNSGQDLMIRVSANIYNAVSENKSPAFGVGLEAHLSGGDHWIVVHGNMNYDKNTGNITMTAFDMNKGLKTFTLSSDDFKKMSYDVLKIEVKKK